MVSVLLIYPPFSHPRAPHLALPTLLAYLKTQNIPARGLDANLAFFRYFLTKTRVEEGRRWTEERLQALDAEKSSSLEDRARILTLATLLQSGWGLDLSQEAIWGEQRSQVMEEIEDAFRFAAVLASAPYEPEGLVMSGLIPAVQFVTPFSNFSTRDILAGSEKPGMMEGFFYHLLTPVLSSPDPPLLIGLSVGMEDQIQPAIRLARAVKKIAPQIHLTLGGSFVSTAMRRIRQPEWFDVLDSVILDDGEEPLKRLYGELASSNPELDRVPGIIFCREGEIRRIPPARPLDLESLPSPDFSWLDLADYLCPPKDQTLPFRSSRGCYWAKCAFCRTDSPVVCHYQQASAEYLFDSLKKIVRDTGVTHFAFTDEASAPLEMERLSRRLVEERLGLSWATCFRLETSLNPSRCFWLRKAGLGSVNFGLESYNDRLLKLIQKGTATENVQKVLTHMAQAGIFSWTYMMVGLPTETETEAVQGFTGVEELQRQGLIGAYSYSAFQLYPDSEFFREAEKYGIRNIIPPPGQDLDGPILDFEAPGMSRSDADRLCTRFNMGGATPQFESAVPIEGALKPLKHDLNQIFSEIIPS